VDNAAQVTKAGLSRVISALQKWNVV